MSAHPMTLPERMVEAAAIARHEYRRRLSPLAISFGWYDLDPEDQGVMLGEARAALTAALAVAEGEGVVLCKVPGAVPEFVDQTSWHDCHAATLAGRVTL
jgi:hypothetical protein